MQNFRASPAQMRNAPEPSTVTCAGRSQPRSGYGGEDLLVCGRHQRLGRRLAALPDHASQPWPISSTRTNRRVPATIWERLTVYRATSGASRGSPGAGARAALERWRGLGARRPMVAGTAEIAGPDDMRDHRSQSRLDARQ
jgi:hypothetical protein